MGHAGVAKQRPVGVGNRVLVAQAQRRQHAGHARVGHALANGRAQALAGRVDLPPGRGLQALGRAHHAAGAQAVFEQPQLGVEAARVGQAMGAFEPCREAPALARRDGRAVVAEQHEPPGHLGRQRRAGGADGFDGEFEAPAGHATLAGHGDGQRVDTARH